MRSRIVLPILVALLLALAGCHDDGDEPAGRDGGDRPAGSGAGPTGEEGEGAAGAGGKEPGGEDRPDPTVSTEERSIRIVIDSVLTGGEPLIACDLYVTPRYLRTAYGGRDGCIRAQGEQAVADSVRIRAVKVEDLEATAVAVPKGGASDGEELEVALVRVGSWRIDGIRSDVPVGP